MKIRLRVRTSPTESFEWEHAGPRIRIGKEDCQLAFQGEQGVSRRHAEIELSPAGAVLRDAGSTNGTYLNGAPLLSPTRLSVGDQVALGLGGPRLDVLSLDLAADAPVAAIQKPAPADRPTSPSLQGDPALPSEPASSAAAGFRAVALAAVVAAAIVGGIVWMRGNQDGSTVSDTPQPDVETPVAVTAAAKGETTPPAKAQKPAVDAKTPAARPDKRDARPPDAEPQATETRPPTSQQPPTPQQPQLPAALVPALAAYRLIAVEDPETETIRPYAGAVIVAPHALVTTADVGIELARIRKRGWAVNVLRDSQDPGVPVERVRIQAPFQEVGLDEQLYFDVAILSVKERLDGAATPASSTELNALTNGAALTCLAANHSGEPFDRFEELRPAAYRAEVRKVNSLSPEPGAPRVLSLHGQFADNAFGSPIFNDKGHLVALYCDAAPLGDGTPDRANHYAVVVEMGLVKPGVAQDESTLWIAPVVPSEPAKQESIR